MEKFDTFIELPITCHVLFLAIEDRAMNHTEKVYEVLGVLLNSMGRVLSQCKHKSSCVYFKYLTMLFVNDAATKLKENRE